MKKTRRHALTLLEVVIAIGITGMLLSVLWGFYRSWYASYAQVQEEQIALYRIVFVQSKLQQLGSLVGHPSHKNSILTYSQSGTPAVCFFYEPEIEKDPLFRQTLRSVLYLDAKTHALHICTFAEENTYRQEVLLDKVTSCEFSFFDGQTLSWTPNWTQKMDHLPLWMKMQLQTEGKGQTFIVRLSSPKEPILYLGKDLSTTPP